MGAGRPRGSYFLRAPCVSPRLGGFGWELSRTSQGQVAIMVTKTPQVLCPRIAAKPAILCFPIGILDLTSGLYLILNKFNLVYSHQSKPFELCFWNVLSVPFSFVSCIKFINWLISMSKSWTKNVDQQPIRDCLSNRIYINHHNWLWAVRLAICAFIHLFTGKMLLGWGWNLVPMVLGGGLDLKCLRRARCIHRPF